MKNHQDEQVLDNKKTNIKNTITCQNKKIEDLKLQLSNNQNKINDITLRKLANIENIKKNTQQQIKNIKQTELETFLKTIIPIIDSLEDIVILSNELEKKDQPLIEGIALTLQSLLNILYKLGVKIEGKKNDIFNPKLHNSILIQSSSNTPPGHIISVQKNGLTFNKILLRKAIVTISKK
ncbi:nucleotide exchange factor GrpE [Buchnera aphidicola]|uniref:Protein GrpE n=1 Tax=Buchnera aphidicola str. Ua (Uroleucon ambrosiae) TaxID=1005057 RepID=G2LP59_BUCUM|nr:nucleotide exchange factor GrpE [Buchnera aphidicola]AEO07996.1 heat shock protein GrpE2 [Buchnera aphidicola str. Ua (Uroleucon ambrosiae)]